MENTIFIVKDMLRYDIIECNGGPVKTPVLNKFSNENVCFKKCYSTTPGTTEYYRTLFGGNDSGILNKQEYFNKNDDIITKQLNNIEKKGFKIFFFYPIQFTYIFELIKLTKLTHVEILKNNLNEFINKIEYVKKNYPKYFIILHLPHSFNKKYHFINNEKCKVHLYNDILELDGFFDVILNKFGDSKIVLTADHGFLYGEKNLFWYGTHLYQPVVHVPLIMTGEKKVFEKPVSTYQIFEYLIKDKIKFKNYLIFDTARTCSLYYRSLAVIKNNYKFIFEINTKNEYLFDLEFDKNENINLLQMGYNDIYRKGKYYKMRVGIMQRTDWKQIDKFYEFAKQEIINYIEMYDKYISFNKKHNDIILNILNYNFEIGKYEEVIKGYYNINDNYKYSFLAGIIYLKALIKLEYNEKALKVCCSLLKQKSYNLILKYYKASLLKKLLIYDESLNEFEKLLDYINIYEINYRISIYFHLGEIYYLQNSFSKSIVFLKKCINLLPTHKVANELLKNIISRSDYEN